jgi:hypothetical protein
MHTTFARCAAFAFFLLFTLFAPNLAGAAPATETLARVTIVKPGDDLETIRKQRNLSYYLDLLGGNGDDVFLVVPEKDFAALELFEPEIDGNGALALAKRLLSSENISPRTGFIVRMRVSEGIPNLVLCLSESNGARTCWTPRYSGVDNSLVLDPGFAPAASANTASQYSAAAVPLLTNTEFLNQPLLMVWSATDKSRANDMTRHQINALADRFKITLKGQFRADMPNTFVLLPLVTPVTVWLHATKEVGGDSILADVLQQQTLKDGEAMLFSLDFAKRGEDRSYAVKTLDARGDEHIWWMQVDAETGKPGGFGFGPAEKFIPWGFD